MKSAFNASRLRAVSLSVSPFFSDDASAVKLMISAERRCSESSKLIRVRVEGSINRLMTVLPRSAGTFLMTRSPTALNARAVSSTVMISSEVSDSMSSRCRRVQFMGREGLNRLRMLNELNRLNQLNESSDAVQPCLDLTTLTFLTGFSWFFQIDGVFATVFLQLDVDSFGERGRDIFADEIRFDGQLAMPAIDQHGQL